MKCVISTGLLYPSYFFYASSPDLLEPGFYPFRRKRFLAKAKVSISLFRKEQGIIWVKVSGGIALHR